jgi:transcriptional regulator with XRE-family HTH domain
MIPAERIGESMADFREARGLTVSEAARLSRLDRGALSRTERGLKIPRVRTVVQFFTKLGADSSFIGDVKIIGQRIRLLRTTYLLSQTEFGRLVRAEKEQLSEWERGEIVPSLDALARICDAFGVGLGYFLSKENADEKASAERAASMENVGPRIRQLCAAQGISMHEAERRARLCRNTLWPIVHGHKKPRGRVLLRIAKVLGHGPLTFRRFELEKRIRVGQSMRKPRAIRKAVQP